MNADEEDPLGSKHVQHYKLSWKNKGFLKKFTRNSQVSTMYKTIIRDELYFTCLPSPREGQVGVTLISCY